MPDPVDKNEDADDDATAASIDDRLERLNGKSDGDLEVTANDIQDFRDDQRLMATEACALCDAPRDACDECDIPDGWERCLTCDEGDPGPEACTVPADEIPCWGCETIEDACNDK